MKRKIYFFTSLAILAIIGYMNWDAGGDIDLSKVKYNVLRLNFVGRQIFEDSLDYHYVTKTDIRQAEKILRTAFDDYNRTAEDSLNHEDYGRQYMAAKTPTGDIIVYVNCFVRPEDYGQKWLYRVDVSDGGDLFFEGMINLTKGEIIYFGPHGSA